jgi:hypothetical protein
MDVSDAVACSAHLMLDRLDDNEARTVGLKRLAHSSEDTQLGAFDIDLDGVQTMDKCQLAFVDHVVQRSDWHFGDHRSGDEE